MHHSTTLTLWHPSRIQAAFFFLAFAAVWLGSSRAFQHHRDPFVFVRPLKPIQRSPFFATRLFAIVNNVVSIEENAPRDIGTMDQWATECGVERANGLELTAEYSEDGVMDVYAMTALDLPANTLVLYVPSQLIFSAHAAVQEFGRLQESEILFSHAPDQLPYFYLVLKLLVEYEKGQESPWFPWLNSLPRYFSNGASLTDFCYECLPPLARKLAMQERVHLIYCNVSKVPFLSQETKDNKDLIKWAFNIVYTRGFASNDGSGDVKVAPVADLFNHGSETEIEIAYDEEGNGYAQTTRDVPAGSMLRMSYGDPTNPSFLFARYGFLDESSPATFCKLILPHTNRELEDLGYVPNRMLFFKDSGEVSEEVWDVLLYRILAESNVKERRQFYQAHVEGDYETKQAFHEKYYSETSAKLLEHLDTFLADLETLSSKAYGKDINEHPRIPLILRHNQFVKNTFLAVRNRYFSSSS